MQVIFSDFYRSLLIYFMFPLSAAGFISETEIMMLEAQLIREQFGLKGDVRSEDI